MRVSTPLDQAQPLSLVRVVQFSGIGPITHAALLLSTLGADIVRIEPPRHRLGALVDATPFPGERVALDLKDPEGLRSALLLVAKADVLIEAFRPGVMERLGLGPEACLEANPRLVYGRMTGWGQDGPLAQAAGHDINYIALTGALAAIGAAGPPPPPLNLIGDYGGGSMFLLVGVLAALLEREGSGHGQVVDTAMVDGVAMLMQPAIALARVGMWSTNRGSNLLDGGAPFYRCYACADGGYVAVGALEPAFYSALVDGLGLDVDSLPSRDEPANWPVLHEVLARVFASRTRDEWSETFAGTDACVTPVLDVHEAALHPHIQARGVLQPPDTGRSPVQVPHFSRSAPGVLDPTATGSQTSADAALRRWDTPSPSA